MKKINIAEILKGCPIGMELDCTMYDSVTLLNVNDREDATFPIKVLREDGNYIALTKYGQYTYADFAKCVIFPKGKTTWVEFEPPYEFKDGDIVTWKDSMGSLVACIYKERLDISFSHHIALYKGGLGIIVNGEIILTNDELRLATEEEKAKLFDAIKKHGYKWNADSKTLEELPKPKFKVGDKIVKKGDISVTILISEVDDECYYSTTEGSIGLLPIAEQDEWELVPDIKPKFKVGDRIRSIISNSGYIYNVIEVKESLYVVSKNNEYDNKLIDFKIQDCWELVPNKFDITTLKPFDKVLVRHNKDNQWCGSFFSHIDDDFHSHCYKYVTITGKSYPMCIPYEGNEHLLGTTYDCIEYYKTWE